MRFGDLREMSYDEYVATAPDDAFWFFLHIPKTAGSSFSTELATQRRPYRNIHVDYSRTDLTHNEKLAAAVDAFIADPRRGRFRSASGHIPFHLAQPLRDALPNLQAVTILRAPEARVISDYRYQRTAMHPDHERFKATFPTIESYVEDAASQNKMAHFIGGGEGHDVETLRRRVEEDFAFVGLLEMYPLSFNTIFTLMGVPGLLPTEHRRKTPDSADTAVEITPALSRRIRDTNERDFALFDHVRSILAPHRESWRARLARRPAEGAGRA